MKNEIEKTEFKNWCRLMFDENCSERWACGQQPYKDFKTYYTKNLNWLTDKYENRTKDTPESIYLS